MTHRIWASLARTPTGVLMPWKMNVFFLTVLYQRKNLYFKKFLPAILRPMVRGDDQWEGRAGGSSQWKASREDAFFSGSQSGGLVHCSGWLEEDILKTNDQLDPLALYILSLCIYEKRGDVFQLL